MDSWSAQPHTPSPTIKFENSPTESLLSTPGEMFPSLFGNEGAPITSTEAMSPDSFAKESTPDLAILANLSALSQATPTPETPASSSATPEPEKKTTKKRKSWGQVLPEPKTNLPPRKRAKTEDEKEQRRVERVLRNRRAAQSSRERKRLEVEGLEKRNKELEAALRAAQLREMALMDQLRNLGSSAGTPQTFPITFSQELFSSQDGHDSPHHTTVDPAALSPALTPISEVDDEYDEPATAATPVATSTSKVDASPDSTQHPAAMLCQDLQCRSAEAPPSTWMETSQQQWSPMMALFIQTQFLLTSTSALLSHCRRPLMQIAMSLKAGFSLPPAPPILNTIIWLVTTPKRSSSRRTSSTSTSTTTSTITTTSMSPLAMISNRSTSPTAARSQTRPSSSLRLRLLRKILTCSPILARPLTDATMEVLRLVSSEGFTVDGSRGDASAAAATDGQAQREQHQSKPATWPEFQPLPSREALLTLLWALNVEERRTQIRCEQVSSSSDLVNTSVPITTSAPTTYVLNVFPKRKLEATAKQKLGERKRRRFA